MRNLLRNFKISLASKAHALVVTTKIVALIAFILPCMLSASSAQQERISVANAEIGAPYIENYEPDQYNAGTQNWSIAQTNNGLMYFGNNSGVLEFDGQTWRTIPVTNRTAVRALAVAHDGRVYVGAQGEIGYLAPDSNGFQQYISLNEMVPERYRDFADIAKTYASEQGIYFQALDRVFLWSNGKMKVWMPELPFHLSFMVEGIFYIRQREVGLMKIENDSLIAVPAGADFADERIYAMLPYGEKEALVFSRTRGLFRFTGERFLPFRTEVDQYLADNLIYHAEVLRNGDFAIATLRGGVAIIDQNGGLRQIIGKTIGVQDDNVKYLLQDHAGGLWLALNNGITRVEIPSPISLFDERFGVSSSVNAIARHQGKLYVGTADGLYVLAKPQSGTSPARFLDRKQFIEMSDINAQTWALLSFGDVLLASTSSGVYQIQNNRVRQIRESAGHAYMLFRSLRDPAIVYVGLQDGLAAMRYDANRRQQWHDLGKVADFDAEVRSIEESADGKLWLATRSQGFYRLDFSDGFRLSPDSEQYSAGQGLQENHGWVIVFSAAGRMFFVTANGLFQFDEANRSFLPDTSLGIEVANGSQPINFAIGDANGNIWLQSESYNRRNMIFARRRDDGGYERTRKRYNRFADFRAWIILPENDQTIWFGGPDGLVRYDMTIEQDYAQPFSALVRAVTFEDSLVIFGGAHTQLSDNTDGSSNAARELILPYSRNALRFAYSATSFEQPEAIRYQVFLEGFANNWSAWTSETKKDYTNIPEGDYRFRIRARNIYEQISMEDAFAFRILAPWYRSWWAFILYTMLFGVLVFGLIRLRTRQLEARSHELEGIIKERTQEILDTQEQLIVQEKMASLGQMTAGIAHEIKNPLNFVNNFAEGAVDLADELDEAIEKHKESLQAADFEYIQEIVNEIKLNAAAITENGKRADSIVKSMMDHARDTKGEFERLDLNSLLNENIGLAYHGYRAKIANFEVDIQKDFDTSLEPVKVIPQDLSRVFLNLISNACYALNEKQKAIGTSFQPLLHVSTRAHGSKIEVRIRDNGPGIPEDLRRKIFNPFFTTKPTGEGNTGLWLSISYDIIVKQHKGELAVDSKVDEYTEFLIVLPAN